MNRLNKKLLSIILLLFACFGSVFVKTKVEALANSTSEIVMEVNTNRIVYENNARIKKYMASTTKILTAIAIIENCDINEKVVVTKETVGVEGSSIYLVEGEVLTVKELLYGLMLRSGNDCAETLAVHCSKTISNFAELMNNLAKKIGANDSHFVNPHGLHNDNHYTTAYDLALISCYAMKNPIFREIVSTKSVRICHTKRDYDRILVNKNKMLSQFEGSTGIKTGYTKKAGRCLVSSCKRNGLEFVCVVLNCGSMFERSKELLNSAFENYSNKLIIKSENILLFIPIKDSNEKCGVYIKNDVILPLTNNEFDNLIIKIDTPKIINKSILKDDCVGEIQIYYENNLLFEEKIYSIIDVNI